MNIPPPIIQLPFCRIYTYCGDQRKMYKDPKYIVIYDEKSNETFYYEIYSYSSFHKEILYYIGSKMTRDIKGCDEALKRVILHKPKLFVQSQSFKEYEIVAKFHFRMTFEMKTDKEKSAYLRKVGIIEQSVSY